MQDVHTPTTGLQQVEDGVIMCAPTNFIKRRLSAYADTLHGMVDIPMGRTFYGLKTNHTHLRTLATCHTIIVDEAFMVTAQNLEFLLTRLSAAQDLSLDAVLEHNTIVLVGDEKQLPPICQSTCLYLEDVCTLHHIAVSPHFRQAWHDPARNFFLAVNHRNPAIAHKLAHIANQHNEPLTQAWVDENINNAYCRVAPLDLDTRVLVTHHADALSHNTAAVNALAQNTHSVLVPMTREFYRQAPQLRAPKTRVLYDDLNDAEKLYVDQDAPPHMHHLAVGSEVRFFKTVNKDAGFTTAEPATILGFNYRRGRLTGVKLRLHATNQEASVQRISVAKSPPGEKWVQVSYWPIAPVYAATVHCVQGAGVDHVLECNLTSCFERGLAYTALSRNTTEGGIRLTNPLTPHDLTVIDLERFYTAWQAYLNGGPPPRRRERT